MTLLDRILAYFGYIRADAPRPYERIANGMEAVARGQRWQGFYEEESGLADMLTKLRRAYFEKVGATKPGDTQTLLVLGLADKIVRELDREVQTVIETGKIRAAERAHVDRVAGLGR